MGESAHDGEEMPTARGHALSSMSAGAPRKRGPDPITRSAQGARHHHVHSVLPVAAPRATMCTGESRRCNRREPRIPPVCKPGPALDAERMHRRRGNIEHGGAQRISLAEGPSNIARKPSPGRVTSRPRKGRGDWDLTTAFVGRRGRGRGSHGHHFGPGSGARRCPRCRLKSTWRAKTRSFGHVRSARPVRELGDLLEGLAPSRSNLVVNKFGARQAQHIFASGMCSRCNLPFAGGMTARSRHVDTTALAPADCRQDRPARPVPVHEAASSEHGFGGGSPQDVPSEHNVGQILGQRHVRIHPGR